MDQVSHVPGESSCALAVLFDPGRTRGPGHVARGRGPRVKPNRRLTALRISRLNRTASALAVYASQSEVALRPRKTRFRLPASSTGRDWSPAGFQRKVSKHVSLHDSSSFPKFYVTRGSSRRRFTVNGLEVTNRRDEPGGIELNIAKSELGEWSVPPG